MIVPFRLTGRDSRDERLVIEKQKPNALRDGSNVVLAACINGEGNDVKEVDPLSFEIKAPI